MKYTLYTLIYIIKDWDLSLDEFKPIGKILWWIPNLLNNILLVLFRLLFFPFIWFSIYLFEKNKYLFLRFLVIYKTSFSKIMNDVTNQ